MASGKEENPDIIDKQADLILNVHRSYRPG
jgi:hypothetical protein